MYGHQLFTNPRYFRASIFEDALCWIFVLNISTHLLSYDDHASSLARYSMHYLISLKKWSDRLKRAKQQVFDETSADIMKQPLFLFTDAMFSCLSGFLVARSALRLNRQ